MHQPARRRDLGQGRRAHHGRGRRRAALVPGTPPINLYKNNTDNKGASYGTHENYLMRRETPFADIVRHLTPFFVCRQVVCGSGRVGIGQDGRGDGFQICQRADYFEVEVGLETTLKRPIINTRDEPHAVAEKYRRLHVIIGDANLAEVSTYLKLGTTALVLAMIEDGFLSVDLAVDRPVATLHAVSHDPSLQQLVTLRSGRKLTAVQLQMEYAEQARKYVEDRYGADADAVTADVLDRWESVLTPAGVRPDVAVRASWTGWPSCRSSRATAAATASTGRRRGCEAVDLQYSDVRPDKGLYNRLQRERPLRPDRHRRRDRPRDHRAAGRHPRLLPRPLPGEVPRRGRRRVVGLGHLRPARAATRCSACRRSSRCGAPRSTSATCSTAARPPTSWCVPSPVADGPDPAPTSRRRRIRSRSSTSWVSSATTGRGRRCTRPRCCASSTARRSAGGSVGGWSLEADPRAPRRRHEDIDVAVRSDQADEVRAWLRDFHLWRTDTGSLRPLLPGDATPEGLEQMWVRRDAWSPWLMDLLVSPVDGSDWVYKRDHRVRLPLADMVRRGPDGVPYQVPQVGLLFKAKLGRDKDEGDLSDCWPRLDDDARRWLREALELTSPGHPWSARLTGHAGGAGP